MDYKVRVLKKYKTNRIGWTVVKTTDKVTPYWIGDTETGMSVGRFKTLKEALNSDRFTRYDPRMLINSPMCT